MVNPFQLISVKALPNYRLELIYADNEVLQVDLTAWIGETNALSPLKDADFFAQVKLYDFATAIFWIEDELDLGADNLRNLAIEQSGGIGHERIWNWLYETDLTVEQGALALGISVDELLAYRNCLKPIPRMLWLACLGWDAVRPHETLPMHIPSVPVYAQLHSG